MQTVTTGALTTLILKERTRNLIRLCGRNTECPSTSSRHLQLCRCSKSALAAGSVHVLDMRTRNDAMTRSSYPRTHPPYQKAVNDETKISAAIICSNVADLHRSLFKVRSNSRVGACVGYAHSKRRYDKVELSMDASSISKGCQRRDKDLSRDYMFKCC
jgi:hypothetical protein